jgi:hypothetical protein
VTRHERVLLTLAGARGEAGSGLAVRLAERHLTRCAACQRAVAAFAEVDLFAADVAAAITPADRPAWEPALRALVARPSASRTDAGLRPVRPAATAPSQPVPAPRRPARLLPMAVAWAVLAAVVGSALWLRAAQRDGAPPVNRPAAVTTTTTTTTTTLAPTPARKAAAERAARALVRALNRGDERAVWSLLSPGVRATDKTPARALARFRQEGMLGHVPPDARFTAVRVPTSDGLLHWAVLARSPSGTGTRTGTGVPVVAVTSLAGRAVIDEYGRRVTGLTDNPDWLPEVGVMKSPARISWRVVPARAVGRPDTPIALATADVRAAWIVVDTRALPAAVTRSDTLWDLNKSSQTLQATATGVPRLAAGPHTVALVLVDRLGHVQTSAVWVAIE